MRSSRRAGTLLLGLLLAVPLGAAAQEKPSPIRRLGKTVTQYKDGTIQVVASTKWLNAHMDEPWTVIEVAMRAVTGKSVRIDREDVQLAFPGGIALNLPTQKRMAEGVKDVRWLLHKVDITREPVDGYFPGALRFDRLGFFSIPGQDVTFDQVSVNRENAAWGDLFFDAPDGKFPPGNYALLIHNKDVDAEIRFTLPAKPWPEPKGDDKTVPW